MKIEINKISAEGFVLQEEVDLASWDLSTEVAHFCAPLKIKAKVSRITNAVTISLDLKGLLEFTCSRCLKYYPVAIDKRLDFSYPVGKTDLFIDLDPEIREELFLDYPIQPLCQNDCKGLCPKCGADLNQGGCNCATT